MSVQLLTFSGSPFGWAVQLAAALKKVELDVQWLRPSSEVLKAPEHLALNPRGKLPVLRDGEFYLSESPAILAYLDANHPEPPLFGNSAEQRGRASQVSSEIGVYLSSHLSAFAGNIFTGRAQQEHASIAAAGSAIVAELLHYETRLALHSYVALDTLSAADLQLYPMLKVFLRAASHPSAAALELRDDFESRFPALAAWMPRIEALPHFASTLPPGW